MIAPTLLTTPIPTWIQVAFIVLPGLTWGGVAYVLRSSSGWLKRLPLIALAWMALTGLLAWRGVFQNFNALPPPFLIPVLLQFLGLAVILGVVTKPWQLTALPQAGLVALQAFRIPTEFLLAALASHRLLPSEMTFSGRNFDILSGVLGLLLGLWIWRRGERESRKALLLYNILGLILVTLVVVQGVLSAPTPLQQLHLSIDNIHLARFPLCWLPFALVPAAYTLHFLSLRKLFITRVK